MTATEVSGTQQPVDGPAEGPASGPADGSGEVPPEGRERRRALSGGLWLAATQVMPMATTLLLSVAIERTLGKTALGQQGYVALVSSLLVTLLIGSLSATGVQLLAAARGRDDAREVARLSRLTTAAVTGSGALCAAVLLAIGSQQEQLRVLWLVAAVTAVVDGVGSALQARIIARDGWQRIGSRRLVSQVVGPLLGVVALLGGAGLAGVFTAHALAATGLLVALVPLAREPAGGGATGGAPGQRTPLRPMAALAGGFLAANFFVTLLERRIEGLFLSDQPAQLAAYSVAFNLFAVASFACGAITAAAMPSIATLAAAGESGKIHDALARAARLIVTASLLLGAAVASVGPTVILVVYDDLPEAAALVPWICLALVVGPLAGLARVYWSGLGRLRPVLVTGAAGLAVDVAVAAALVPGFGAAGAVAANLAGVTTAGVALLVVTDRRVEGLRVGPRPVLGALVVAAPSAAAAVAVTAAAPGVLGMVGAMAAFCAVALVVSRLVHPVAHDDVAWLAGALPDRVGPLVRWLGAPQAAVLLAGARGRGGVS